MSCQNVRAQELCKRTGGHPGLPTPNSPQGIQCLAKTYVKEQVRAQELCKRTGGHPGLPTPNSPQGLQCLAKTSELRSYVKEQVDILGSPPLIVRRVYNVLPKRPVAKTSELRSYVKEQVDILGSPPLIVRRVYNVLPKRQSSGAM